MIKNNEKQITTKKPTTQTKKGKVMALPVAFNPVKIRQNIPTLVFNGSNGNMMLNLSIRPEKNVTEEFFATVEHVSGDTSKCYLIQPRDHVDAHILAQYESYFLQDSKVFAKLQDDGTYLDADGESHPADSKAQLTVSALLMINISRKLASKKTIDLCVNQCVVLNLSTPSKIRGWNKVLTEISDHVMLFESNNEESVDPRFVQFDLLRVTHTITFGEGNGSKIYKLLADDLRLYSPTECTAKFEKMSLAINTSNKALKEGKGLTKMPNINIFTSPTKQLDKLNLM